MDWDNLQELEELDYQFPSEERYCDSELKGAITEADAPTITVDATFALDPAVTKGMKLGGKELAGSRRYVWRNSEGYRLDYFVHPDEGYFIAFGSERIEKMMGNLGCHPFVCTKKFSFVNSDGSTFDEDVTHLKEPTPEQMDWDKLTAIEDLAQLPSETKYTDHQVKEALTEADAPKISVDATYVLDPAISGGITLFGEEIHGEQRYVWRNSEGNRLEYFIHPEQGYFIAFGSSEQIEKVMGNLGRYPFVQTKKFSFVNNSGITEDMDTTLVDPTPEQVAEIFNRKTLEYLFNQIH